MTILDTLRPTAFGVFASRQGFVPRPTGQWRLDANGKLACRWRLDPRQNGDAPDSH